MKALTVADVAALAGARRRTRLHRIVLGVSLVALTVAAALLARSGSAAPGLLPASGSTVVVIDLSGSTQPASRRIASALLDLTRDGRRRIGLVVFSDTGYEALPPGAPVAALRDWLALLADGTPRSDPWAPFSGGTAISSGLSVARRMLLGAPAPSRHVLLVSDLVDDPADLPRLQSVVADYQRERIDLRVIRVEYSTGGGSPAIAPELPNAGFVSAAADLTIGSLRLAPARTSSTVALLVLVVAAAAGLATVYELALHPLTWGRA